MNTFLKLPLSPWLMATAGVTALSLFAGLLPSSAQAYTFAADPDGYGLDFELDGNGDPIAVGNGRSGANRVFGDLISNQWESLGVRISEQSNQPLTLFNTNCRVNGITGYTYLCTGGDSDLATGPAFGTTPQGNVLIIQENANRLWDPDDDDKGGVIEFDFFSGLVNLEKIALLDINDSHPNMAGVNFTAWFENGTQTTYNASSLPSTLLSNTTGDNSLYEFDLSSLLGVSKLAVDYGGSGAIAYFDWEQAPAVRVPEPIAVVGLIAVGVLGYKTRSRQA